MADTSPHARLTCEICGINPVAIKGRCSPCFWDRPQPHNTVHNCAYQYCPFDAPPGEAYCSAHSAEIILNAPKIYDVEPKALKFDSDKLPLDLLPAEALEEIALVFQHGAKKYEPHNWRKGFIWSRPYAAILRHLFAYWKGEDIDPESGLSHLAHAGCGILFLISFAKTKTGVDDRYKSGD